MSVLELLGAADPGSVQSLPWVAHAVVGVTLAAGIIMWLSGAKLLKPVFCVLGAMAGGGIGFFLGPTATSSVFNLPSPYVGLAIGGLVGLIAGIALFRFAVAISTGLAFGIAGLLIAVTYLNLTVGLHAPRPTDVPTAAQGPATSPEPAGSFRESAKRVVTEGVRPVTDRVRRFVKENSEDLKAQWEAQTEHNKVIIGVSGLMAGLFGFFLSLFAPSRSTSIATSLFGSAVALGSAVWLLRAFDAPGSEHLVQGPMVWLGVWIVAAVLGFAVQVRTGGGKKQAAATPS